MLKYHHHYDIADMEKELNLLVLRFRLFGFKF